MLISPFFDTTMKTSIIILRPTTINPDLIFKRLNEREMISLSLYNGTDQDKNGDEIKKVSMVLEFKPEFDDGVEIAADIYLDLSPQEAEFLGRSLIAFAKTV